MILMVSSCHRWWVVEFIISPYHHQHWGPCICRRWWPSTTHTQQTHVNNKPTKSLCASSKSAFGCREFLYYIFMEHIKSMNIYLCLSGTFRRCLVARNCHRHFMSTYTRFAFHLHSRARGLPTQRLADKSSQQALSLSGTLPREFPVGMYTWYAWHHDWLSLSCSNECINSISDALTSRW